MTYNEIIDWLLDGDVSIQYQTKRDLLGDNDQLLQKRIAEEGWGKSLLSFRKKNGHWGDDFYQPKWISTHYVLLDLKNLGISKDQPLIKQTIDMVLEDGKSNDGGIRLGPSTTHLSDDCVNGMFLNYAAYFKSNEDDLKSIVDCILNNRLEDGGFNCRLRRSGARHSSLHTTISILEGLYEFIRNNYNYRREEVLKAISSGEEFILLHQLFISDRTGEIIKSEFLKMPYPSRWKFDFLRGLDYFQYSAASYDQRLDAGLNMLKAKRNKNGTWNMQAAHPGNVYFTMEKAGKPGRWNTLRALRVLKHFEPKMEVEK